MSKKLKQVKVNFYQEQHQLLKQKADENNMTIAQYIRQKLELELDKKDTRKKYQETKKIIYSKTNPELLYQLSKVGNNLNQIARNLNSKKDIDSVDILQTLLNIEKKILELSK